MPVYLALLLSPTLIHLAQPTLDVLDDADARIPTIS